LALGIILNCADGKYKAVLCNYLKKRKQGADALLSFLTIAYMRKIFIAI